MWKGVLFALVSCATIVMGLYSVIRVPLAVKNQKEPMPFEINYDERVHRENVGIPLYLQVPTLYLYSDIEAVKPDAQGYLIRPKDVRNIGWFSTEEQPLGKKGVVVLAGEFDRVNGLPDTFYHVSTLEKNDSIEVADLNGKKYTYTVTEKKIYNWDSTNVSSLLIKSQTPKLNIIIYPAHTEEHKKLEASQVIIYAEIK